MNTKDSFILYKSFFGPISGLSNEQLGKLFKALFEWQITGPNGPLSEGLDDVTKIVFGFFTNQFRIDDEKYNAKCEKNRQAITQRWEREAIRTNTDEYERKRANTNGSYNDNENDNENENGNDGTRGKASTVNLPYNSELFVATWNELRSTPKWKHKTAIQLQKSVDKLSAFPEEFAVEVMNTAIANGTQGLVYDSTRREFEQWQQSRPTASRKVITKVDELI